MQGGSQAVVNTGEYYISLYVWTPRGPIQRDQVVAKPDPVGFANPPYGAWKWYFKPTAFL